MLFVDSGAFLENPALSPWWVPKTALVDHCSAAGNASALLSLRHSVHFTFSDVLVAGAAGFRIVNKLRKRPTTTSVGPAHAATPTQEALSLEGSRLCCDFATSHVGETSEADRREWVRRLHHRVGRVTDWYRVLAAAPELGLPPPNLPAIASKL
eukprot:gnl/TRDRNA2_/TRDRNA2_32311_c0_seq1.p1 gnl/TRDRNA2_/TRDRNA2_32311_c0~~gnl/TRDRNA2_/TRDRNA2_32311_c0_seq1.p1  ORF type:complete len:154 (+),score=16.98 gnl/TRDRNA2_/TRDRNA2_32311_c0_seq1:3-464(+)